MQPVQHPALPPQLALQLPPMDTLSADLTQLCQQQLGLDPNFLRHSQFKRPRTRITDDQLKILRAYFDINNSPSEEQIQEMAEKSGLSQKVIKHWFRNTLFKERQRNKDSPYNFSNPPITVKRSSRTRFTDYQLRYLLDSNPTRKMLDHIAREVGLKKRVVQVWFQNTRARERKGQFRAVGPAQSHKSNSVVIGGFHLFVVVVFLNNITVGKMWVRILSAKSLYAHILNNI
uniref:Homeobox domain-containing protein n=1 Tax=Meleagris gallopavo TaxID=9103 RepID=A0A803XTT1_MELGA